VYPRHYPTRPEELVLCASIVTPLRDLQALGFLLIVITNQSGIARGLFTETDLSRMHRYLCDSLAAHGVSIHAVYFCPHHPDGVVERFSIPCDCRKPAPGMLVRAALEHQLDLGRSWFLGDILDDVEAGNRAGCRTVLVDLGTEAPPTSPIRRPDFVAPDTACALRSVLAEEGADERVDRSYLPPSWRGQLTPEVVSRAGR
jgi:D-glycero-D-manno-heptose 1,7-bisphosphate phosphatase